MRQQGVACPCGGGCRNDLRPRATALVMAFAIGLVLLGNEPYVATALAVGAFATVDRLARR